MSIGYGRGWVKAKEAINTSGVELPNQMEFQLPDGTWAVAASLSHSSISTYMKCNRMYYYDYVLRQKAKRPAISMWWGIHYHHAIELALQAKMEGKPIDAPKVISAFGDGFKKDVDDYETYFKDQQEKGNEAIPLEWSDRAQDLSTQVRLGEDAVSLFMRQELPKIKPLAVEKQVGYRIPMKNSSGSVFFSGFVDLIEEFEGEPMITDHKTGRKRTPEDLVKDDQLTFYTLAEGISQVSINSVVPGTTGGSQPKRARPPEFLKLTAKKTIQDQERTIEDFNLALDGIKRGSFGRTGKTNGTLCSSSLCAHWPQCMAGK